MLIRKYKILWGQAARACSVQSALRSFRARRGQRHEGIIEIVESEKGSGQLRWNRVSRPVSRNGGSPHQSGARGRLTEVQNFTFPSLALRPTWSLERPGRPRSTEVLRTMSLPPSSAPIGTGWSDSLPGGIRTR